MIKRWTLLLIVVFSLLGAAAQTPPAVEDAAGILDESQQKLIEKRIEAADGERGYRLFVRTVKSLEGRSIESLAGETLLRLESESGGGAVLLLVAPKEHRVRIETAPDVRTLLTDERCRYIVDRVMLPLFKKGQPGLAVLAGVEAIEENTAQVQTPRKKTAEAEAKFEDIIRKFLFVLLAMLVVSVILMRVLPFESRLTRVAVVSGVSGVVMWIAFGDMKAAVNTFAVLFLVLFFGGHYYGGYGGYGGGFGDGSDGGGDGGASGSW